jgi:hypothetical protein
MGGYRNKRFGLLWKLDETPTRIHFALPEKMYRHTSGDEFPFRAGTRYWVPWGGKAKKGAFLEVGEKSIIDVYKNPAKFGLNIAPIKKFKELHPQIYYSTAAWVEEEFHLVEKQSTYGDKGTYRERERCTKRGCPHCAQKWPKVFGRKVYLDISMSHWNQTIYGVQEKVASSCKCGGFIYTSHYECNKCKNMLVDVTNTCFSCGSTEIGIDPERCEAVCQKCSSTWSLFEVDNPEIRKAVADEITCPKCSHKGYPVPVQLCTTENCPGDPYSIYDCQMRIQMVSSPTGKNKELRIDDVRIQPPDARLFNPEYQGVGPEDSKKGADYMKSTIDLDKMLSAIDIEEEAAILGIANPFSTAVQSAGYAQYGAQEEAPAEEHPAEPPKGPNVVRPRGFAPAPINDDDVPF